MPLSVELRLLTTFAKSLNQAQDVQNVGPDLDPNHLTLIVFLKEFFEKVNFEKKLDNKTMKSTQYIKSTQS